MKKISFNEFNKKAYLKVLDEAVSIYDRVIPNLMKKGPLIREDYVSDLMIELEKEGFTRVVLNDTFLKVLDSKSKNLHSEPDYYDFIYLVSLFDKDIIRENITRLLDDPHIRYDESNRLMIRLINNDPEIVFLKVKNDKRKYIVRGFSDNNFLFGDEIDTDSPDNIDDGREEEYLFRQILFQATYGTARNLENLFNTLRNKNLIEKLLDNDMFLVGKKNSSYIAFINLYQILTSEELEKYNDKIMKLIKECNDKDMYKVCYKISKINAFKKSKKYDRDYMVITGLIRTQGDESKSMLANNFNELIKLVSINRRADLFMLALCDKDTNEEDLAKSMYHLRREDIEVVLASLLRHDTRFLLKPPYTNVNDYYAYRDDLDYMYLKERLVRVITLNEELSKKSTLGDIKGDIKEGNKEYKNYSIFNNVLLDELKLKDSPYVSMLNEFFKRSLSDSMYFTNYYNDESKNREVYLNRRLLEYERLNLIKILSMDSDKKKQKILRNIIDSIVINRDLKEDDKFEYNKKVTRYDSLKLDAKENVSPYYYSHKKTDSIYEKIYELVIREYYKNKLGIDINSYKPYVNENISKDITYGIELEVLNIEHDYKSHKLCNDKFSSKSELSVKKINKDEIKTMPNYYRTRPYSCEFTSKVLNSDSIEDLEAIYDEVKTLNHYGAEENCSTGVHIHVSSKSLFDETDPRANKISNDITKEVYNLEDLLVDKLCCYESRLDKTARMLVYNEPDLTSRYKIVNVMSLIKHGTIEFRLFNMPDRLDPLILDSYIDFALCFYDKVEKGYKLSEIVDEASKMYESYSINSDDSSDNSLTLDDYKFKVLLETLECKDETKLVLENLDDIFKFYAVKDVEEYDIDLNDDNDNSRSRDRDIDNNKDKSIEDKPYKHKKRILNYYDDINYSLMHEEEVEHAITYDEELLNLAKSLHLYDMDLLDDDKLSDIMDELITDYLDDEIEDDISNDDIEY